MRVIAVLGLTRRSWNGLSRTRIGIAFSVVTLVMLVGTPIDGGFLGHHRFLWHQAIVFCGASVLLFFGLLMSSSADISFHPDVRFGGLDVHGVIAVAVCQREGQASRMAGLNALPFFFSLRRACMWFRNKASSRHRIGVCRTHARQGRGVILSIDDHRTSTTTAPHTSGGIGSVPVIKAATSEYRSSCGHCLTDRANDSCDDVGRRH